MRIIQLFFVVALLSVFGLFSIGCATPRVGAGPIPEMKADEGIVVIVSDSDSRISSLYFQTPDFARDIRVGNIDPGKQVVAIKATAGVYCLREIFVDQSVSIFWADGSNMCFNVVPNSLGYVTHLIIRNYKPSHATDIVDATQRLRSGYPELIAKFGSPNPAQ